MTEPPPRRRIHRPQPEPLPCVVLARELTPADVKAGVRTGSLERIRPGAYLRRPVSSGEPSSSPPTTGGPAEARELALARIAAVGRTLRTPFWFSHESAALLWGCPLWTAPTETHIIQTIRPSRGGEPSLRRHLMSLTPADRQEFRGVPTTSLDRTVVDCLHRLPPLDALVMADGALRLGADRAAIAAQLDAVPGRRGAARARVVFVYADDGAESPWETFVRYTLVSRGLPRPELQIPIHTRLGWFWSDLGWTEWKQLIEFDGFTKYSGAADPARVVFEEKRRQEALEEEGWGVLRVTAADLRRPEDLIRRVCRRLPPGVVAQLTPNPALLPRPGYRSAKS